MRRLAANSIRQTGNKVVEFIDGFSVFLSEVFQAAVAECQIVPSPVFRTFIDIIVPEYLELTTCLFLDSFTDILERLAWFDLPANLGFTYLNSLPGRFEYDVEIWMVRVLEGDAPMLAKELVRQTTHFQRV